MGVYAFEGMILAALYAMRRNAKLMRDIVNYMSRGMFKGLVETLVPEIMDGSSLYQVMVSKRQTAFEQGYHPLTTTLTHIFALPCGVYINGDRNYMDTMEQG